MEEGEKVIVRPDRDSNNPWDKNAGEEFVVRLYEKDANSDCHLVGKISDDEWPRIPPGTSSGPTLYTLKSIIYPARCEIHETDRLYYESKGGYVCPFCYDP